MTHTYSIPPHLSMCACGVCTSLQSHWLFHPRRRRKLCSSPAVKRWNLRGQQLSPHWFFAALGCRSHFQVPFPQHLQVFKHPKPSKTPNKKSPCLPDWQTRNVLIWGAKLPGLIGDFKCEEHQLNCRMVHEKLCTGTWPQGFYLTTPNISHKTPKRSVGCWSKTLRTAPFWRPWDWTSTGHAVFIHFQQLSLWCGCVNPWESRLFLWHRPDKSCGHCQLHKLQ